MRVENIEVDVLIVGGGSAAIAALEGVRGMPDVKVALLERNGFLGGTATAAEVGTLCGLYYRSATLSDFVNPVFAENFTSQLNKMSGHGPVCFDRNLWFVPYNPVDFKILADKYAHQNETQIFLHATVFNAEKQNNDISKVSAIVHDRIVNFYPSTVIDCSGEAIISKLVGDRLIEETSFQAGALVFEMQKIAETDHTVLAREVMMTLVKGVQQGELQGGCERVSLVPGSLRGGTCSFKFSVPDVGYRQLNSLSRLEAAARTKVKLIAEYLIESSSSFKSSSLSRIAQQIGVRTGPRPLGQYILSKYDVVNCVKRPDSIAKGAWPIEKWGEGRLPEMIYFEEKDFYDIPLGCICSIDSSNLFFAGKNLSADEDAIASARVIGTCFATGYAAGCAAVAGVSHERSSATNVLAGNVKEV